MSPDAVIKALAFALIRLLAAIDYKAAQSNSTQILFISFYRDH